MKPVIFTIAKYEKQYIEEFVMYHLGLGFSHIYIYDNEDVPTYKYILDKYILENKVTCIHYPGNDYQEGVQGMITKHFIQNFMFQNNNTHTCGIDIDEFIVLKRHNKITNFIKKFIVDDVAGITMNWRFFGSSNLKINDNRPVTQRFIMRQKGYSTHVKTIFDNSKFSHFRTIHIIEPKPGFVIKDTNGNIINHIAQNINIVNEDDDKFIQLNHYSSKTLDEFLYQRKRGCCDRNNSSQVFDMSMLDTLFLKRDLNDVNDLFAYNKYKSIKTSFIL
jgi:hypothetical protein